MHIAAAKSAAESAAESAATANPAESPPSTLRAPGRVDLFGNIHKGIRLALTDLLGRMGNAVFADPATEARIVAQLDEVVTFCEDHRTHEDRLVLPVLGERLHGTLDSVHAAHACQPVHVAELRALADALRTASEDRKQLVGRTLYLHFSTFAAELLLHMAEEERVIQPLLERSFSDDELSAIQGELIASLTPAEKMRAAPWLLRGTNRVERALFLRGVAATAPRAVVDVFLGVARGVLSETDYADLVSSAGL